MSKLNNFLTAIQTVREFTDILDPNSERTQFRDVFVSPEAQAVIQMLVTGGKIDPYLFPSLFKNLPVKPKSKVSSKKKV